MAEGLMFLVAVMDWYRPKLPFFRLSHILDTDIYIGAVSKAI